MVYNGAKRLVLTSRSGLKNDYQKYIVNRLKAFGKQNNYFENQVMVSTANCFTIEGTKQLLDECKGLGAPIGGVFHLALELNNCLFSEVSFETFMKTVDIKEKIFKNLDQLSRELDYNLEGVFHLALELNNCLFSEVSFETFMKTVDIKEKIFKNLDQLSRESDYNLDHFVVFSSISSGMGIAGDINYNTVKTVENSLLKLDSEAKEGSKSFINKLWGSLGIDPSASPADITLGEIGIESIFASELQQELGKLCNQAIKVKLIKDMSVGLLREFESGGDDTIKAYFNGIMRARISLSKYRFVIPVETHVRLNGVSNGKPLYLMPTLEM
ncbi:unnamed protein product, partial [Medioppia subpectinata]